MVICLSGEKLSIKNSFKIFTSIETGGGAANHTPFDKLPI